MPIFGWMLHARLWIFLSFSSFSACLSVVYLDYVQGVGRCTQKANTQPLPDSLVSILNYRIYNPFLCQGLEPACALLKSHRRGQSFMEHFRPLRTRKGLEYCAFLCFFIPCFSPDSTEEIF